MTLSVRRSPADLLIGGAYFFAAALFVVAVELGHRGVAISAGLMAFAAAFRPSLWRSGFSLLRPPFRAMSLATTLIFLFAAWIAATFFWSPIAGAEWLGLSILAAALVAGAVSFEALNASRQLRRFYAATFIAMVAAGAAVLLFDGVSGGYIRLVTPPDDASPLRFKDMTALGRGVTACAPLVFPAAALIRRSTGSWLLAFAPALTLLGASMHLTIDANTAAIVAGLSLFLVALAAPRGAPLAICAAGVFLLVAAPFAARLIPSDAIIDGAAAGLPPSWAQRLIVWRYAAETAFDCLPFGCGADFARSLAGEGALVRVPGWPVDLQLMPTHPHNLFLQIWLELGLPGVALMASAACAGILALRRAAPDRMTAAAIAAALAAALVSFSFEASLWQIWRLAVLAFAAFGCALCYSAGKPRRNVENA